MMPLTANYDSNDCLGTPAPGVAVVGGGLA
jgi:hypothetical protein